MASWHMPFFTFLYSTQSWRHKVTWLFDVKNAIHNLTSDVTVTSSERRLTPTCAQPPLDIQGGVCNVSRFYVYALRRYRVRSKGGGNSITQAATRGWHRPSARGLPGNPWLTGGGLFLPPPLSFFRDISQSYIIAKSSIPSKPSIWHKTRNIQRVIKILALKFSLLFV